MRPVFSHFDVFDGVRILAEEKGLGSLSILRLNCYIEKKNQKDHLLAWANG